MNSAPPKTGCWIYAVQAAGGPAVPPGLLGVADEPVRQLEVAGLVATVGTVPMAALFPEHGPGSAGRDRPTDHGEAPALGRLAMAHHRVVTALAMTAPLVPFRLGTVCADEQAVSALLLAQSQQLAAALRLAIGRTEWGVKVFLEPPEAPLGTPLAGPAGSTSAEQSGVGTAYLLRRRSQLLTGERRRQIATRHADEAHRALAALAEAFSRFQVHDPWTAQHRPWTILSASYLVSEANLGRFTDTVQALRRYPGIAVDLTGPWPAYSLGAGAAEDDPARAG